MTLEPSMNTDDSVKYWNDAWLDQLIEEAFKIAEEKNVQKTVVKK